MEKDSINGKMEVPMKDNFLGEKGREEELGKDQMEILLKDSITMIWRMAGENSSGQMGKYIKESSKTMYVMEKVHIVTQVENWVNLCGIKER